jgi:hypothetical protein
MVACFARLCGRKGGRAHRRCRALTAPERLEDRRLLSVQAQAHSAAAAVWNVRGTKSNDVIIIDRNPGAPQDLRVFSNGTLVAEKPAAQVKVIHVVTGEGNDVVRVDESVAAIAVNLVVNAGSGDVRVVGGSGRNVLHAGSGNDTLSGPGKNTVMGGSGHAQVLHGNANAASTPQPLASITALRKYLERAYQLQHKAGTARHGKNGTSLPTRGTFSAAPTPTGTGTGGSTSSTSHSQTNNQVAGVNEADIVQTDGKNLYILTQQDLVIVAAQPAQNLAVASKTTIEGSPIAMFLDGTRVTVISQVYQDLPDTPTPAEYLASSQTKITVFDVSNPAAPQLTSATYLDGYYVDSRETGGALYVVVQNDVLGAVAPANGDGSGGAAVLAGLSASAIGQVLPTFDAKAYGPSGVQEVKGLLTKPADILGSAPSDDDSLVSVVQLNPGSSVPTHTVSVFTPWGTTVYASTANLYLLTADYTQNAETTTIDKFALGGAGAGPVLVATGAIPGAVFDSYSVDESGPYLRVATSLDEFAADGTDQSSAGVYVLSQKGSNLVVTGMAPDIMPGSSIDTARFLGNAVYLTTFGSDSGTPLVAVDLSNPSAPRVAGTLNDAASTDFLQPIDATHLVGIGQVPGATDPTTNTTYDQLELSVYDVSNPANPTLATRTILDDGSQGGAYSAAEYDPHALLYVPASGLLAIPVTRTIFDTTGSGGGGGGGGVAVPVVSGGPIAVDPLLPVHFTIQSALDVFQVDPASGLTRLGAVSDTSEILRGVQINDVIYAITNYDVQASRLTAGLPAITGVTIEPQSQS